MNLPEHAYQPSACDLRYGGYTALLADHTALVERLGKSPEQVLVMALERLYVQYPTGEVLDGGPAEYTLAADNGRHMSEIARDALKDGDAWICLNS